MRELTYFQAINEALAEEMKRDETVFILGEDVQQSAFMATAGLVQQFGPDRVMDTPISECAIAGATVGAAMAGFRPVGDMYLSDFMLVAASEILINAAKWRFNHGGKVTLPLVFLANIGGGFKLGSEHSQTPTGYLMHTPGLKVAVPSTPYDAKGLLKTAIRDNNPVIYCYNKGLLGTMGEVPEEEYTIKFGKADVKREGTDVTVVATSQMVSPAMTVAEELAGKISVEVIDPLTLVPLDMDTIINSVKKTGRLVVVDEDVEICGPAGEICMQVVEKAFDFLDGPPKRVAAANMPIPGGVLEEHALPQARDILAAIEAVV